MTALFCSLLFCVGIVVSQRAAGPIYAFERFLNDLFEGKDRDLKLRTGDDFIHLEALAKKIKKSLSDTKASYETK